MWALVQIYRMLKREAPGLPWMRVLKIARMLKKAGVTALRLSTLLTYDASMDRFRLDPVVRKLKPSQFQQLLSNESKGMREAWERQHQIRNDAIKIKKISLEIGVELAELALPFLI